MRLTTLMLIVTLMQVSATGLAQKVSLAEKNAPLKSVLKEIRNQSGYDFVYSEDIFENAKPVNITLKNAEVKEALNQVFKDQNLTYAINRNTITVKEAEPSFLDKLVAVLKAIDVTGRVVDENNQPIIGATVKLKDGSQSTVTNVDGFFSLKGVDEKAVLVISSIGYLPREIGAAEKLGDIKLEVSVSKLEEVSVVSNGYQKMKPNEVTGSITKINNDVLNRRISTNILERLEGVASGVRFQTNIPGGLNESPISVRGRSTIFANTSPLIVLDNFPYSGDISNINPNDIETIDILKDASAAAIWGALSGNGVIVITTKKGRVNRPLKVELNSNFTIGAKPDLFYSPNFLPSSDFIDLEKFLFSKGFYDADLSNTFSYPVISPVVELLSQQKSGLISQVSADAAINNLRAKDFRSDLEKYFYRPSFNQQYSANISGGGDRNSFSYSMGYDKNKTNLINNDFERFTLSANNTFQLLKNLNLSSSISLSKSSTTNNSAIPASPGGGKSRYYPYASLISETGTPLPLERDYRLSYIKTLNPNEVVDWTYIPLNELSLKNNNINSYYIRFNPSISYSITKNINFDLLYQYEKQFTNNGSIEPSNSYATRNKFNLFTQVSNGVVSHPVPFGGINSQGNNDVTSNNLRASLSFNKSFGIHKISAFTAVEQRESITKGSNSVVYGYNTDNLSQNSSLDYSKLYSFYNNLGAGSGRIPTSGASTQFNDEFISYIGNASYSYNDRLSFSGSIRYDQSNFFGLTTNQKGVPLWSTGIGWNIEKEKFYNLNWLSLLKLRATYGFNGNLDRTLSGLTTIKYVSGSNLSGLPYAGIGNIPNPELRWEKDKIINVGIDFQTKNDLFQGSVDYYIKDGTDLIGNTQVAPQTGFSTLKVNYANMKGRGLDVNLNINFSKGPVKWSSNILYSYNIDEVTKYNQVFDTYTRVVSGLGSSGLLVPVVGKPVFGIYSYRSAGLDPLTGDPRGYLNGVISKDYAAIKNSQNSEDIVYNGSARPTSFGSFINTISYKNFSFSANVTFKLGYYFRRSSVNYGSLFNSWNTNKDYLKRWKNPGDEKITAIPSLSYPNDQNRDDFFTYSETLIEKGDHIRLQDLRFVYGISRSQFKKLPFDKIQFIIYATNLGIIWRANNQGIDPDNLDLLNPKSISFGLKSTF